MKIIFVTEIQDPIMSKSSTNILTKNLLIGFRENGWNIHLVGVLDGKFMENNVRNYYKEYVDDIIIVKSKMRSYDSNKKYIRLFQDLVSILFTSKYEKEVGIIIVECDSIIVSHTPSIEASFVAKAIKKQFNIKKYIQFWSDPIALAGISIKTFGVKRYPHYIIEKTILRWADIIVYLGEPLMVQQSKLYPTLACKMNSVPGCYRSADSIDSNESILKERPLFGYSGSYNPYARNILPLYQTFTSNSKADLKIIGKKAVKLEEKANIKLVDYVVEDKIMDIEKEFDVIVCLTNHSTVQIPGKIFYSANKNKIILVILDGEHADETKRYLEQFKRFEFCYNNESSIKSAIDRIVSGECKIDMSKVEKLSPKSVAAAICNEYF